jgi:hypothetical protein
MGTTATLRELPEDWEIITDPFTPAQVAMLEEMRAAVESARVLAIAYNCPKSEQTYADLLQRYEEAGKGQEDERTTQDP